MSSINFLPDDDKGRGKLEKKVRTIEYTQPEESVNQEKKSLHGGVLSIFKRSSNDFPKAPKMPTLPPKPGVKPQVQEPIVKSHNDIKKVESRTVIAYQKTENKKKVEGSKEKKPAFGWLKRLFARSAKAPLAHPAQLPPLPPKPYTESHDEPSGDMKSDSRGASVSAPKASAGERRSEFSDAPSAQRSPSLPPPPPRYNPFNIEPPKPQEVAQGSKAPSLPPPPPLQVPVPGPSANEPKAQEMTEAQVDVRPRVPGMSFDVNLVPDELVQRKRTMSRLTLLGVVVLVSGFICLVLYGILAFYKTNVSSNVVSVQEETARVQQQIDALTPVQRDALVLQKRTEEIEKLLDSQIYWTKLFTALEKYTMKNVTLLKVIAGDEGQVSIQAEAPDAATAFEQIEVFQNASDFVQSLSVSANPSIPDARTVATIEETDSVFISPTDSAPGTEQTIPKSNFSVQIQLAPGYLTSTHK